MRVFLTSLMAVAASGLAGGIVAQQLAVWTGAGEEFVAVFFLDMMILLIVASAFFLAQFFGSNAVSRTALGLIACLLLLLAALGAFAFRQSGPGASRRADAVLIGSIALSGFALLFVHWLVIRWRMR